MLIKAWKNVFNKQLSDISRKDIVTFEIVIAMKWKFFGQTDVFVIGWGNFMRFSCFPFRLHWFSRQIFIVFRNSFWVENQIQKFSSWWNGKSQESPTKNFYRLNLLPLFRHVSIVKMFGNFLPTKISNSKYFHETKFTRVKLEKSGNFYSYEFNVKNVKNLV